MNQIALHAGYLAGGVVLCAALLIAGIAFAPKPLGFWCKSVFRAGDYLIAALLGGDGRHSLSAYCGAGTAWYHRAGRWAIDGVFGEGHCRGAAIREGLLNG